MRQPIPPQLEVAAAAAQGPDAGMGRTMRVRQPLDDTHGCCGHGAGAQEVAGGDRPRHAPKIVEINYCHPILIFCYPSSR